MGDEEFAAIQQVLSSGWITTGPKNQHWKKLFAR
jgi:hypothetical protein